MSLLPKRDRRRLAAAATLQMATSILDLAGVLLVGLVGVVAVASSGQATVPAAVESAATAVGLEGASTVALAVILTAAATALLLAKSVVALVVLRRIFKFLANRCAAVSANLGSRFLSASMLSVQSRSSQESAYALGAGVTAAIAGILGNVVVAATETSLLVLLGVALLVVDPMVTVVAVIYFAAVALLLQRVLGTWAGRVGETVAVVELTGLTTIQEAIIGYREIFVGNRRAFYRDRFRDARREVSRCNADSQFITQVPKYVMEAALIAGAALLLVSQLLSRDTAAAVATLALFLAAGSRVMPSIMRLQAATTGIRMAAGAAQMTFDLEARLPGTGLQTPSRDELAGSSRTSYVGFEPTVEVAGVSLSYGGSNRALDDVSLSIPAGSSCALVGATGAGKSSLADVILGIVEPDEGTVLVGGVSPADAIRRWPGSIAYVPQSVASTNGTVRENVALGLPKETVDDGRVWQALRRARLDAFLADSREGLDTPVGEHGIRLSGGQRQRLGLARALYTDPRLLVLDEATSALDAETEREISETVASLEGEVTVLVIAHRLATVMRADQLAYLENGRVIAYGTFSDVRATVPRFDRQAQILGL